MPEISATECGREKGGRSQGKHFILKSKFTWINVAAHHIHRYLLLLLCGLKLSGWLTPPPESSTALSENNPPASSHTRVWRYVQPGHWSALSPLTAAKGTENKAAGGSGWRGAPPPRRESRFLQDCERLRGGKKTRNDLKLWEGSIMWHAGFHSVLWFLSVEKYLKPEGWREETAIRRRRLKNTACGLLHQKSPRMYFIFSHQPLSLHRKEIHSWQRPVCSEADKYGIKFIYIRLQSCLFSVRFIEQTQSSVAYVGAA